MSYDELLDQGLHRFLAGEINGEELRRRADSATWAERGAPQEVVLAVQEAERECFRLWINSRD